MIKNVLVVLSSIVVVIVIGCGHHHRHVETVWFQDASPGYIKTMTFNIRVDTILDGLNRWSGRREKVIDIISQNASDVVATQEGLRKQIRDIQDALPQYSHYAVGRDDGRYDGESCAIFYRKSRFTMDDCGTFWFSNTPSVPGSKHWGNIWPRLCSWVHLIDKQTGSGFYVYNVHLSVLSQHSRQKSMELLAQRIDRRKQQDPFIVMGDFNMTIDNPAMAYLQNAASLTPYPKMNNAWQAIYPGRSGVGTIRGLMGLGSAKIDHITASTDMRVLSVQVDRDFSGRKASDHFPVVADIFFSDTYARRERFTDPKDLIRQAAPFDG